MNEQTIMINGTAYNAVTGLPVTDQPTAPPSVSVAKHSFNMHQVTQKSHTLNRRSVSKTVPVVVQPIYAPRPKSPMITKFAPHPAGAVTQQRRVFSDISPMPHPIVKKVEQRQAAAAAPAPVVVPAAVAVAPAPVIQSAPKPSAIIKQEAISEALATAKTPKDIIKKMKKSRRFPRLASIMSISLAVVMLGGYFTYLNMPSLETRVAAAQAGVDATFPAYHPDGYSLSGALAWQPGQVSMKFASNSGPQNYTVVQQKSNYDSSAVKENYATPKWGENVSTDTSHGLTIYSQGGNAAWVNSGILYTIEGNAPLTGEQIRRIAAGL